MSEEIEAKEMIVSEEQESHRFDWDRLRDANDFYEKILFSPNRVIDVIAR